MHPVLIETLAELTTLVASLKAIGSNEPISVAHSAWNIPGVTRDELVQVVERITTFISERGTDQIDDGEKLVQDYKHRLEFLRVHTVPYIWSANAAQAVPAFMITMQGLQLALEKALPDNQDLAQEIELARFNAKKATTRLRALAASLNSLEPRSTSLEAMVGRIETANSAADQLPIDLELLKDAKRTIEELLSAVTSDSLKVANFAIASDTNMSTLVNRVDEAEEIVNRCSSAYSASTSHGLAAAFSERANALGWSMWFWVGGLVMALVLGSYFGSTQLHIFSELVKQPDAKPTVIIINLVLALLSVGATVWFSWTASKQIGYRFRLAEDYGFKASVSRAYEGYRREAASIDEKFVSRLFSSVLSRLDEQPLRLVETDTHGSPWHELASSALFKKAIESVPNFASTVSQLAKDGLEELSSRSKAPPVVKATSVSE
jgi:hypothetical protein